MEPSSAPRSFDAIGAASCASGARRRGKKHAGVSDSRTGSAAELMPPPPPQRATRGAGVADTPTTCLPRRSQQNERQHSLSKRNPAAPPTPSPNRLRNPVWRYALMSIILVGIGLAVRYLWRQLAGLVGAALILSTAGRWPGRITARRSAPSSAAAPPGPKETRKTSPSQPGEEEAAGPALRGDKDGGGRGFADAPAEMHQYWADAGPGCSFFVRGPKYVDDKKKVGHLVICGIPACRWYFHVNYVECNHGFQVLNEELSRIGGILHSRVVRLYHGLLGRTRTLHEFIAATRQCPTLFCSSHGYVC